MSITFETYFSWNPKVSAGKSHLNGVLKLYFV